MKINKAKRIFYVLVLLSSNLCSGLCYSDDSKSKEIRLDPGDEWGQPEYSQYTAPGTSMDKKTHQWRYTRNEATLIVTKTVCPRCKPVSQQDVDAYNQTGDSATRAIMVLHKGGPAVLRLYASPKGENLHTFQTVAGGFQYEFQLGIDRSAPQTLSFRLEMEFLDMIGRFQP